MLTLSSGLCLVLSGCIGGVVNLAPLQTLVASPSVVDLGNVPVGNSASASVSVVNSNSVPVTVTQVSLTGQSFSIAGQNSLPITIASGSTYSFNVNFVPATAGQATGQMTISTNAKTSPTLIALSGTGAAQDDTTTPQLTGLTCASASMGGTGTDLCTATISAAAVSPGFRVALSSNNAAMTTSSAALVQTGNTSVQFKVSVTPVSTPQTATLTATAGSVTETFAIALTVPVPTLSTSTTSVAFGNVTVNTPTTKTVTITSTGTAALTISGATVTGAGFTLTSGTFPLTLNPGQTTTLSVQYDPSAEGAATGQLSLASNSSVNSTTVVALSGTGEPQLIGLTCASASMGGTGTDLCTETISGPALAPGFRVALSSNNPAVTTSPAALVQTNYTSAQFTVNVTPVSTPQTVTLTATAGTITKTFAISLTAPTPTLSLSAASVAFGNVTVNTPSTQTVTLSSTGTAALTISGATVTGSGFSLTPTTFPITLNPGQATSLSVQFDPSAENATTGQLTITSNSSASSTAVVALSGTGEPQLTGVTCANASMGGTGTDLCTVTISGPALSPGFRVALSSNNAAVTASPAALVQTNNTSAQFTVNVTPVSTPQTVTLTATAVTVTKTFAIGLTVPVPTLSVSATSLAFGNATVNTPVAQAVTLTSTGTAAVTISGATVAGTGFILVPATFPITLNPGQTTTLSVQYDPTVEGAATGQLSITSNSSVNSTAVVALSGTGLPQLTGIACTVASITGTATDLCTVTISGPALSPGFRVALSSNNAAVTTSTAALVQTNNTSAQFTVNIALVSTAQAATLTANVGGVTEIFALQLNAAYPTLSTSSASVAFGNVAVNVPVTQTLTLISSGAAPVTVNTAAISGTGFTLVPGTFPMTLNPSQTVTLGVLFNPAAAGAEAGQLTVTSNSNVNSTAVIPLTGTGAASGTFSYAGSPIESTLVPPNPTTPISPDFFGMTVIHSDTPFPAFPVSTFRFWDVAAWSSVETSSGVFNWLHMDEAIATGQANGVSDYIFTFGSVPAWASTEPTAPCTGGDGVGSCAPPDMVDFDAFATAVVQRYCGTIKYYETWNEPNNSFYWNGTNAQLLMVAQHLNSVVKSPANCGCTNGVCSPNGGVNPNKILSPPISDVNPPNLAWLDSYLSTAGATYPYADVAAFHGYAYASAPEEIVSQVQSLNQTLANHGMSNLQLWNTEASWGNQTSVDQDQAAWVMRYHAAMATTNVSRFIWYAYDSCGWGTLWEAPWCTNPQMPLSQVTEPGTAYPVIENWLSGATLDNCQLYENGLWSCELQRPGNYSAWMVWSSTGTEITVPIPEGSGLTVYRDSQNNVNALPAQLTVGEMPVLIGNLNP
jgi:hypothetical protein